MVFYVCNYDVITKARMISLKKITYSAQGALDMCRVSIFSMGAVSEKEVQRYSFYPNMAATPCDLWPYNYHFNILHEYLHLWWKFVSIRQAVPEKREKQNAHTHVCTYLRMYGIDHLTPLFASRAWASSPSRLDGTNINTSKRQSFIGHYHHNNS